MRSHLNIDKRFTDLADKVSEEMGKWWVSVVAFILILIWTLFCATTQGAGWWYGLLFNMPLNLATTVAELFIGFLLAAAANRAEKRNRELQEKHARLQESQQSMLEKIEKLVEREEAELQEISEGLGIEASE